MKPHIRVVLVTSGLMLLTALVAQMLFADPPRVPMPVAGEPPDFPAEASHAHYMMFRIMEVTPLERVDQTHFLKLDVERFYGKINSKSKRRADEHETQRLSILFPASPGADIRPGDLINYRLVRYAPIGREAPAR